MTSGARVGGRKIQQIVYSGPLQKKSGSSGPTKGFPFIPAHDFITDEVTKLFERSVSLHTRNSLDGLSFYSLAALPSPKVSGKNG